MKQPVFNNCQDKSAMLLRYVFKPLLLVSGVASLKKLGGPNHVSLLG